ncbi:hypothetical protein, conserved [Babesia bigemina]|uniref:6-Cys domain-containing protein n=1 Tax=Babesia bigemina TaxID=5866 RepID=A0A061DB73_BABBI|nr:hypothetical protein, conserved [Babesia bigemina]CDR97783.1 hypothetical protein, conserved [Babesia bigemina]|eukprot:XP_012769969.1 hypothetical protein, conserved [Babesia bigemina]
MAFYGQLCVFLIYAAAIRLLAAPGAECQLGTCAKQPCITMAPQEMVVDVLDVSPQELCNGISIRYLDQSTYVYSIEDRRPIRSAILLLMGNQVMYVMPHARNLQVKVANSLTTSQILITYEIGGGLFERRYDEELYSSLSNVFWNRVFTPQVFCVFRKEYPAPETYSFFSQLAGVLQSLWTFGIVQTQPQVPEQQYEMPSMKIDLADPSTYGKVATTKDWCRHNNLKVMCASFDNKDHLWNGIYFYKTKIPIPRLCSKFTVCHSDAIDGAYHLVNASLVGDIWVESFYSVYGVGTNAAYLMPVIDSDVFNGFRDLPSRHEPIIPSYVGEGFTLDTEKTRGDYSPIEMREVSNGKYYRYKDPSESDDNRPAYVNKVKFHNIEYTLPEGHTFVLLALTTPMLSTNYATLVTRQGFSYSLKKWYGTKMSHLRPVEINELGLLASSFADIYPLLNRAGNGSSADRQGPSTVKGDIVCLADVVHHHKQSSSLCTPLKELTNTQLLVDRSGITILKVKPNAPSGLVVVGNSILDMAELNLGSETTIYYEHYNQTPARLAITNSESGVRAMRETVKGSGNFVAMENVIFNPPSSGQTVDVNLASSLVEMGPGLTWEHQPLQNVWVLRPQYHPEVSMGSVLYYNCRVVPPQNRGYSFIVAPSGDHPQSAAYFAPTVKNIKAAVLLKHTLIGGYPACSVEPLEHTPTPLGAANVRKENFDTLFKTASN